MSEKPEAHTPRFLAWLYSTRSQQPVLASLCGIEREIGASLRPGVDHHVAHTRLEWWREECNRCAAGNPVHPLTRELRIHLEQLTPGSRVNAALAGLSGLVDAATWDLADATFERREELTAYCRRWAAAMVAPLAFADADLTGSAPRCVSWSCSAISPATPGPEGCVCRSMSSSGLRSRRRRSRHRLGRGSSRSCCASGTRHCGGTWRQRSRVSRPKTNRRARGLLVWSALAWQASLRAERALPHARAASLASAAAANWRAWRTARAAASGTLRLLI